MAKKATDLLDVFRLGSAEESARSSRSASSRRKKAKSRRASAMDGLQLGGRQLLLASCVGVLLIVLAFTIGLGVGRKGWVGAGPKLDRQTPVAARYWIRGQLPSHDHLNDGPVNPSDVVTQLEDYHTIPGSMVRIRRSRGRKELLIDVGPFPTATAAEDFRSAKRFKMIRLRNGSPFRFANVVSESGGLRAPGR